MALSQNRRMHGHLGAVNQIESSLVVASLIAGWGPQEEHLIYSVNLQDAISFCKREIWRSAVWSTSNQSESNKNHWILLIF